MSSHSLDLNRFERCGHPEAIYSAGKTPDEVCAIALEMVQTKKFALITRMGETHALALEKVFLNQHAIAWCPRKQSALVGMPPALRTSSKPVRIVCAGTSDRAVAAESALTLRACGFDCDLMVDVGVAGIHRLLEKIDALKNSSVIIAIAGMEGALPSVIGGLVACPVIAVPTSVGYGVSTGGTAALHGMLGSCAAGIMVVNIDNGFGAACGAVRILGR